MANSASTAPDLSSAAAAHLEKKDNVTLVSTKIAELSESRQELLNRIQHLKQDLQSWRSKLDTQVKVYRDELSELKKSLNGEVEQLRTDFQELKSTLQQQQDDVTASLRNLGLEDVAEVKEAKGAKTENSEEKADDLSEENAKEIAN